MHPFRQYKKYIIPVMQARSCGLPQWDCLTNQHNISVLVQKQNRNPLPTTPSPLCSKEKKRPQALVRTYLSFPCSNIILMDNNSYFPITLLCTIHGPVDILAHRHNHGPPPPSSPPPHQREAATTSPGEIVSLILYYYILF